MKKSINAWSVEGDKSFEEMFRLMKEVGFDGIELNVDEVGHSAHSLSLETTDEELAEIASLSQKYELPIVSISTSMLSYFIGSPVASERDLAKQIIQCQLKCAKALGAKGILVVPGGVTQQESYAKAFEASKQTLTELKPIIMEYQINVGVENVWNGFFLSPMDMVNFIDSLDCPYLGAYYDVGNVIAFSWSEYWIDALSKRIFNIHVKDFKRTRGINSGGEFAGLLEGDVNWKAVIPALRNAGFDGYLTAEVFLEDMSDKTMSYATFYATVLESIETMLKL